ncbi:MAG: NAD(P)H-hydrate dehydratase [Phycisphaerae bacterium]
MPHGKRSKASPRTDAATRRVETGQKTGPTTASAPPRDDAVPALAARSPNVHKGDVGRVAIFAGSRGMSGAALLCASGALRGGAGLVRVLTAASVQSTIAAGEPCCMSQSLNEDDSGRIDRPDENIVRESLEWADVVAVGPGLGQSPTLGRLVADIVRQAPRPCVIDADGLNNLAQVAEWWRRNSKVPRVLTPHPGEMRRLLDSAGRADIEIGRTDESRIAAAHALSRLADAIVILKGHRTVVCAPHAAYVNQTGNAGMATGGMGDVLTGLIAALIGQKMSPFDASRLAVHVHGAAADRLAKHLAPVGYLAREVADAIPAALSEHVDRPRFGFR